MICYLHSTQNPITLDQIQLKTVGPCLKNIPYARLKYFSYLSNMKKWGVVIAIFCIGQISYLQELTKVNRVPLDSVKNIDVITFGSCNHQLLPQEMWLNMLDYKPDLFVFLGDNVYGNCTDVDCLIKTYNQQLKKPYFLDFLEKIPMIGTWDDHDYGPNNSGIEHPIKKESQKYFLDFIGEPKESPRRMQEGIYTTYTFGKEGKKVKFFMLDERYFREKPGEAADILGEIQWKWFEKELNESDAQINIIASSSQFLSTKTTCDRWEQYPKAEKRMYQLIQASKKPGIIFLSGDIHCAEMMQNTSPDLNYPLYEFTASGMSHAHTGPKINSNKYKIQKPFCGLNYGMMSINWNSPITIKIEIKDIQNFTIQEKTLYLEDLQAK
jgi:alkaline phosphatase D